MDFNKFKNIFFTADLHFGHANILKWCKETRPWNTVEEMENGIVAHWNRLVGPDDVVFMVGDIAFMNQEETVRVMNRLNGNLVLIIGNHDTKNMRNPEFRSRFLMCKDVLSVTLNAPDGESGGPQKVVMNHFPYWEWDQMHRGAFHVHGHVHGKPTGVPGRILDAGWDAHGKLLTWAEVYVNLINKPIRGH